MESYLTQILQTIFCIIFKKNNKSTNNNYLKINYHDTQKGF